MKQSLKLNKHIKKGLGFGFGTLMGAALTISIIGISQRNDQPITTAISNPDALQPAAGERAGAANLTESIENLVTHQLYEGESFDVLDVLDALALENPDNYAYTTNHGDMLEVTEEGVVTAIGGVGEADVYIYEPDSQLIKEVIRVNISPVGDQLTRASGVYIAPSLVDYSTKTLGWTQFEDIPGQSVWFDESQTMLAILTDANQQTEMVCGFNREASCAQLDFTLEVNAFTPAMDEAVHILFSQVISHAVNEMIAIMNEPNFKGGTYHWQNRKISMGYEGSTLKIYVYAQNQ